MQTNRGEEERKPVEHMDLQTTSGQLTSFRDTVGVIDESKINHTTPLFNQTNPYDDMGLAKILARTYMPKSVVWSGTAAQGSLLATLNLPHDQFVAANVTDKLDRNAYVRCGFDIEIRSNSTGFNSGAVLICWCPHWNPSSNPYNVMTVTDMFSLSALDHAVFSAQTGETIKFHLVYAAPSSYLKTGNSTAISAPLAGWMGTVLFFVLAPLRQVSSSSTPVVTLQAYCTMTDIDIAGPTISNIVTKRDSEVLPPSEDELNFGKATFFKNKYDLNQNQD
jgi:hypothetical protein